LAFKAPGHEQSRDLAIGLGRGTAQRAAPDEQKKLLASIDSLKRRGGLEVIEGQEEFKLVREGNSWRLFFDWASGIRVISRPSCHKTAPSRLTHDQRDRHPTGRTFYRRLSRQNLTDKEVLRALPIASSLRLSPSIWTSSNAPCFYR